MRASVRTLRDLGLERSVVFVDHSVLRGYYAGFAGLPVLPERIQPGETFQQFTSRLNVGVVTVDGVIAEHPQLRHDPYFQTLVAGRDTPHFRITTVERYPHIRFAVRRNLLSAGKVGAGTAGQ
jgi:hypothetical protein